eukprot:13983330-Alexandrium_andersonii.AAC.1
MSASLVGSEMCIRDSTGRPGRGRGAERWCRSSWRCTRGRGRWWRWRPVSYTHLTLPTICSV